MFKKKKKEPLEPQFYQSPTGIPTYNYNVYYMSKKEKVIYFLIAFIVGAAIGYLFYGGIGKDDLGNATTVTYVLDVIVCTITGVIAGKMFLPIRTKQIIKKKKNDLRLQFRELLDALATSIGSGKNIIDSFKSAYDDLSIIYNEDASIIKELAIILDGNNNNIEIEKSLLDMGIRSGIADIVSFSNVFETCYRKGGDIKDVIKNTQQIINEKMEVQMDIETIVTSSKNEENVMTVLPIGLIALIKMMSPEFSANFVTPVGIISTTIAIAMFIIARKVGQKILDIKI